MTVSAGRRTPASQRIIREAIVSAAINAAISAGFFLQAFDRSPRIPVWGLGNYAFDFLPQSAAIGLMATLVPGLLARRNMVGSGAAEWLPSAPSTGSILRRSATHALLAAAIGGALCAGALWAGGTETVGWASAFAFKLLYGGALGALVTALSLRRLLR